MAQKKRPTKKKSSLSSLSPIEKERLKEWRARHRKSCPYKRLKYRLTPTGIGLRIQVSCPCGKTKDITDYAGW